MRRLNDFNLGLIKNKQWYHQRFDGCPMFMWFIADSELKIEKRKPAGTEADVRICFFDHGVADWYLDMKDVNRGARLLSTWLKRIQKFPRNF